MHDWNGCIGRGSWFGFTENEVEHRTTRIDPNSLRILKVSVMPLRRLLCSDQSLTLRLCTEGGTGGEEDDSEQRDQQRECDTCPEQQGQRPALT